MMQYVVLGRWFCAINCSLSSAGRTGNSVFNTNSKQKQTSTSVR